MNATTTDNSTVYSIEEYYIPCCISAVLAFIAICLCIFTVILVWRTKPRLHTVNHLLMCNTCCASIFVCVILVNNYAFLLFGQWETSDVSCRWRAYLAYAGITSVIYSYLLQAISRFFFSILSGKYRGLVSFRTHYILIVIQWIFVMLIASPAVITKDIRFYPKVLCWVPHQYPLHIYYQIFAFYIFPVLIIIWIYIYIYIRVSRETKHATRNTGRLTNQKRNLDILRSIAILLAIYLGGSIPTLLYQVTSIRIIYLINLVWLTLTVVVEKLCAFFVDREIRQAIQQLFRRTMRVMPISHVQPDRQGGSTLRSFKSVAKIATIQSNRTIDG